MVDVSNREHVVFCVRWVDEDLLSREDFIGLYEMERQMQQRRTMLSKQFFRGSV